MRMSLMIPLKMYRYSMIQRAGAQRAPWVELEGSEADLWRPPGRQTLDTKRQQMGLMSLQLG